MSCSCHSLNININLRLKATVLFQEGIATYTIGDWLEFENLIFNIPTEKLVFHHKFLFGQILDREVKYAKVAFLALLFGRIVSDDFFVSELFQTNLELFRP